jgi:hypothetical protein
LLALAGFRCRCQNIGGAVAVGVLIGDVLK